MLRWMHIRFECATFVIQSAEFFQHAPFFYSCVFSRFFSRSHFFSLFAEIFRAFHLCPVFSPPIEWIEISRKACNRLKILIYRRLYFDSYHIIN